MISGRLELKDLVESIVEVVGHFFEDAHRAVALHVAVATDRGEAGAGSSDGPDEEVEVDDFADGGDGVAMLGDAHGPAGDDASFAPEHGAGEFLDL
jgi:hypothetical protein